MNTFIDDYLERLDTLHQEINNAIESLPQDALDWDPRPGMNSMAVLVTHIAGSLRYWIGDVAANDPSGRDRSAEFRTHGVDLTALKGKLSTSFVYAQDFLPTLSYEDLGSNRSSPLHDRQVTVGWALAHALEHTALHTGHIQLTRQFWDASHAQT